MKQRKHTLRQIRAMAFENGCVWGAAIVAMAEAIRRGPAWVHVCGFHAFEYGGGPCMVCGAPQRSGDDRSADR